jgi:hypothetical protein
MPSVFIGVYKALYPYTAQTNEELTISQNDLLYLLEKSSTDDWWKVKKKIPGSNVEEPSGLVPNNYIQPVSTASSYIYTHAPLMLILSYLGHTYRHCQSPLPIRESEL